MPFCAFLSVFTFLHLFCKKTARFPKKIKNMVLTGKFFVDFAAKMSFLRDEKLLAKNQNLTGKSGQKNSNFAVESKNLKNNKFN